MKNFDLLPPIRAPRKHNHDHDLADPHKESAELVTTDVKSEKLSTALKKRCVQCDGPLTLLQVITPYIYWPDENKDKAQRHIVHEIYAECPLCGFQFNVSAIVQRVNEEVYIDSLDDLPKPPEQEVKK